MPNGYFSVRGSEPNAVHRFHLVAVTARLLTLLAALTAALPCALAQGTEPSPTPPTPDQNQTRSTGGDQSQRHQTGTSPQTAGGGEAGGQQTPPYNIQREEEDYSFLRDRARRTDFWDPLKYIPLRAGDEDWYLTVSGEVRPYYEQYRNQDFGAEPRDANGYYLQRLMFGFDFHFGKRVRAFVQLKSGIEAGRNGGPTPPDENRFDVNQAFVEVGLGSTIAEGKDRDKNRFIVRLGRQELNYGAGRLVSVREGPNVRRGFDGAKIIARFDEWRVDAFAVKPVEDDFGFFDDSSIRSQTFWGVYATRPVGLERKATFDLYYLGLDRKRARFDQGAAREIRHTVGARLTNTVPQGGRSETSSFDYDVEIVGQFGRFGVGNIRAFDVSTFLGYTLKKVRFVPRISVNGGYGSGDRDPLDPDLQTFNSLFPKGRFFGQIGANGPYNVTGFRPGVNLQLTERIRFAADVFFFFRASTRDGVYDVAGNLVRTGQLSRARYLGAQPQAELTYQIDRHTSFTINYARFERGRFIRETPPGKDIGYFAAWITYKF